MNLAFFFEDIKSLCQGNTTALMVWGDFFPPQSSYCMVYYCFY